MQIIKASATILPESINLNLEEQIELIGRVCYKSEDRIEPGSAAKMIQSLMGKHHDSVLEHGSITVRVICDRGVSHELVRHRIASFSQESTRYCNYSKEKFGNELTFIDPRGGFPEMSEEQFRLWGHAMDLTEYAYLTLIESGAPAQMARDVLPNSLKTEVVITANPREWRHIFKLRTSSAAHPQMREIMSPLLTEFQMIWPNLFSNIGA